MLKSYADACLERAEKATEGPWEAHDLGPTLIERPREKPIKIIGWADGEFIAHARTDVPELARRLKKACDALRSQVGQYDIPLFEDLIKELEAMPEGE